MSDRWPLSLRIYDSPQEEHDLLLDTIHNYSMSDGDDWDDIDYDSIYLDAETSNMAEDLARDIIEIAPNTTFKTWTDPKYEWLGSGVVYVPGLGSWYFTSDANANALFTREDVITMLTLEQKELEEKLGMPWFKRLAELRHRNEQAVPA